MDELSIPKPMTQVGVERRVTEVQLFQFQEAFGEQKNGNRDFSINEDEDDDEDWDSGQFINGEQDSSYSGGSSLTQTPQPESDTTGFGYKYENYAVASIPYSTHSVNMSFGSEESSRQDAIKELIQTEENYISDMTNVETCFMYPLRRSGLVAHDDLRTIFVNWEDLIACSFKLLKAFTVRSKTSENNVILMVGDILCQHMPGMEVYIRFCSAQLRSAAFIQQRSEKEPAFLEFTKQCQMNPKAQNLPLSSFLIKPMQRITRYPLLIKKILEHTPDRHPDRQNLEEALAKVEELCAQVNEGVRERENSDRLEWMQNHINCVGLDERLIFNSITNSLGPRKFLHHGVLKKTKSGKELLGLLFNDFLLLAQPNKPLNQTQFSFDRNRNHKFKIYRKPLFLNELVVEDDGGLSEAEFTIRSDRKTYQMVVSAPGVTEKRLWIKSITEAQKSYHKVQQQYFQRQKSKKMKAVGRLLVTVMEANNLLDRAKSVRRRRPVGYLMVVVLEGICLANRDTRGKSDPYCEVSLGSEIRETRVLNGTLNPKWNDSMQFSVKDLHEDILCFTVYDKDYFSPDQFLGRTEISISSIYEETKNQKMPWTKTFSLLEIESGEIMIKLHLQIFEK